MARIRSIKPTFFRSRSVKSLSSDAKLVWIGLWTAADDEGRLLDEVGILGGDLWALSLSASKLDRILSDLDATGRIVRYEIAGQRYIQVTNWVEHQKINRPTYSLLPPPPLTHTTVNAHVSLTEPSLGERKGRERKGGEAEPSRKCVKHQGVTDPPSCRACKDARIEWEQWTAAQKLKPSPSVRAAKPDDGHEHVKHPVDDNCIACQIPMKAVAA
jgi:hypothetical protein